MHVDGWRCGSHRHPHNCRHQRSMGVLMPDGFRNPIVGGGGALIYDNIHSPGFTHGSTGWSINKDGTAEFNGVTVRGTIILGNGTTNTIILDNTRDAMFVYDNAGNLAFSISPTGGTDSLGNPYAPGAVSYVQGFPTQYVQLTSGVLQMHNGDPNLSLLFEMQTVIANGGPANNQPSTILRAPTNNNGSAELLLYGTNTAGSAAPFMASCDAQSNNDMDWLHRGMLKYWRSGGWAETWHQVGDVGEPAFAAGWSNLGAPFGNAKFMRTATGKIALSGVVQHPAAVAAPSTIFTLPAGYRPNRSVPRSVTAIGSDGAVQAQEVLVINSAGNVNLTSWTGTGIVTPISLETVEFFLTT